MPVPFETPYGPLTAVADWLRANDVEPRDVPIEGPITIDLETHGGDRCIRYAALLRTDEGRAYLDERTGRAAQAVRTAPLVVEPPANVQVRDSTK